MKLHTFAVYVEDQPGVLNRVASLFRRRGFNIHSLSVGTSEVAGVSRMTVVVRTDDGGAARIRAHLDKLVHVLRVEDLSERPAVVRDLALIKVARATRAARPVMQLADVFGGRVVDVAPASLVIEICASEARWTACSRCCARTASSRWCAPGAWRWIADGASSAPRERPPRSKRPTACRSRS